MLVKPILFIDDDPVRHKWADEHYQDGAPRDSEVNQLHHVYNFDQFCSALERVKPGFFAVSFDHDIAGPPSPTGPPHEVTGLTCADWMIQRPHLWPNLCIVHSWNPTGAARIEQALRHAGITVFRQPAGSKS